MACNFKLSYVFYLLTVLIGVGLTAGGDGSARQTKPNIVFIISDDQDKLLGSTDFQNVLNREIGDKGTQFSNHYGTTAQCCPARAGILRGQTSHNTNITHVSGAGGNYDKWVLSGQDEDYLPHWLKEAGYRTEYVGKLLNGYNTVNYNVTPKGWDWVDSLLDPYTTYYNVPVMSQNGERPVYYKGWHSTDVVRIKALARLDNLASQDQPFYLTIAPYAPHVQNDQNRPMPLSRHSDLFPDAKAPRSRNFNPADEYQKLKGSWLTDLPLMNDSVIDFADFAYRARAQALQGVDETIEDVVRLLEQKGVLDNTYIVYTADNGYHLGQHRVPAGKALFYAEDTNLPLYVRGPGIPQGVESGIPSTHVDLAPTFLDIAGIPQKEWPVFFDGSSLLRDWHNPLRKPSASSGISKEAINIEFWGLCTVEAPNGVELGIPFLNNSYKTIRMLGEGPDDAWLFSRWCTGETEMYQTKLDPFELDNLAYSKDPKHVNIFNRLNTILLVTKSCEQNSCRDPWAVLDPPGGRSIHNFKEAMDTKYDEFFADFPKVQFNTCMGYQYAPNEAPFYPPLDAEGGLGQGYRDPTDNFVPTNGVTLITDTAHYGSLEQRNATLADIYAGSRLLTDEELAPASSGSTLQQRMMGVLSLQYLGYD